VSCLTQREPDIVMLVASGPSRLGVNPSARRRRSVWRGFHFRRGLATMASTVPAISARLPLLIPSQASSRTQRSDGSGVSVPSGFRIGSGGAFSFSLAVPKVPISVGSVVLRIPRLSEGFLASDGPETLSVPPALRLSHHLRFARFPLGFPAGFPACFPIELRASLPSLEFETS
jgi:hypothetical protein